jgi:hypothetical protein
MELIEKRYQDLVRIKMKKLFLFTQNLLLNGLNFAMKSRGNFSSFIFLSKPASNLHRQRQFFAKPHDRELSASKR